MDKTQEQVGRGKGFLKTGHSLGGQSCKQRFPSRVTGCVLCVRNTHMSIVYGHEEVIYLVKG